MRIQPIAPKYLAKDKNLSMISQKAVNNNHCRFMRQGPAAPSLTLSEPFTSSVVDPAMLSFRTSLESEHY